MKKIIALSLAITLALQAVAFATYTDDQDIDLSYKYAVERLSELDIIGGNPNGTFMPDNTVSRAEMAKMISVMLNAGEPSNKTSTFSDVNGHWAEKFIADCVTKGIIAGKTTTSFDPDAEVTGTEAAKMLLVALGVNATTAELTGSSWADNTKNLSYTFGLVDSIDFKISYSQGAEPVDTMDESISREVAAQMISNALDAGTASYQSGYYSQGTTSLCDSLGYDDVATNYAKYIYGEIASSVEMANLGDQTIEVESQYGLTSNELDDAFLGVTLMTVGVDEIFIAKAKSGKLDTVKSALADRMEYLINVKAFYPGEAETVETAKIYTQGDYIMFVVLGSGDYSKAEQIFMQYAK